MTTKRIVILLVISFLVLMALAAALVAADNFWGIRAADGDPNRHPCLRSR
jgi:hypothetical protein